MSGCSYHASKESIGACTNCGKLICRACNNEIDGKSYCPPCVEKLFTTSQTAPSVPIASEKAQPKVAPERQPVPSASIAGEKAQLQTDPERQPVLVVDITTAPEPVLPALGGINVLWYVAVLFFGWIGGLVAWWKNKKQAPKTSRYLLFGGIGWSALQSVMAVLLIVVLLIPPAAKTGLKPPVVTSKPLAISVENGSEEEQATPIVRYIPPKVKRSETGTILTDTPVELATTAIETGGGAVTVDKPGDPLNGLQITVPPGAYKDVKSFTVSSSPITVNTFGNGVNPITPMITVENGGEAAGKAMTVKIPVQLEEGQSAIWYFYNEKTGILEPSPAVAMDKGSVTVATTHFSKGFLSRLADALYRGTIDSGFRPGTDGWQFVNNGSCLDDGNCEGMSVSAMWYYFNRPVGSDKNLYGLYDNGGKPNIQTPDFPQDDALAVRFCSMIQKQDFPRVQIWTEWSQQTFVATGQAITENRTTSEVWERLQKLGGDALTRKLFEAALLATHEPQLVWIMNPDKSKGAHAMVVYKIVDGTLYIYDPNKPGSTSTINWNNGHYDPCTFSINANGQPLLFDNITYASKATVIKAGAIERAWNELMNKTAGDSIFPAYKTFVTGDDDRRMELADGYEMPTDRIKIELDNPDLKFRVWDADPILKYAPNQCDKDSQGWYTPSPGDRLLGIEVYVPKLSSYWPDLPAQDKIVDFRWFKVKNSSGTPEVMIEAPAEPGYVGESYTFKARTQNMPKQSKLRWYIKNSPNDNGKGVQDVDTVTHTFGTEGDKTIVLELWLDNGSKPKTTDKITFKVVQPPLEIVPNPSVGAIQQTCSFRVTPSNVPTDAKYTWSFGNGKSDQGEEASVEFDEAKTYAVTVTAQWVDLSVSSVPQQAFGRLEYEVKDQLPLRIVADPAVGIKGEKTVFRVKGEKIPEGVSFYWEFGDASRDGNLSSLEKDGKTTYTYTKEDTYEVKASMLDKKNPKPMAQATVRYNVMPPVTLAIVSPSEIKQGKGIAEKEYIFNVSWVPGKAPNGVAYSWSLNSQARGDKAACPLTFTDEGPFALKVKAAWKSAGGVAREAEASLDFKVTGKAAFSIIPTDGDLQKSGKGDTERPYTFAADWSPKNAPSGVKYSWSADAEKIGEGESSSPYAFKTEGKHTVNAKASWKDDKGAARSADISRSYTFASAVQKITLTCTDDSIQSARKGIPKKDYIFSINWSSGKEPPKVTYSWAINDESIDRNGTAETIKFNEDRDYSVKAKASWTTPAGEAKSSDSTITFKIESSPDFSVRCADSAIQTGRKGVPDRDYRFLAYWGEGGTAPSGTSYSWYKNGNQTNDTASEANINFAADEVGQSKSCIVKAIARWTDSSGSSREVNASVKFDIGAEPILSIKVPAEITVGKGIKGQPYYFSLTTENIPSGTEYIWYSNGQEKARKIDLKSGNIPFNEARDYVLRVEARWTDSSGKSQSVSSPEVKFSIGEGATLTLIAPAEIMAGKGIKGQPYLFSVTTENIPSGAEYVWYSNGQEKARKIDLKSGNIPFNEARDYVLRVEARWTDSSGKSQSVSSPEVKFSIGEGATLTLIAPAEIMAGKGIKGQPYLFSVTAKNIPDGADYTWYSDGQAKKKGKDLKSVTNTFSSATNYVLKVEAKWTDSSGKSQSVSSPDVRFQIGEEVTSAALAELQKSNCFTVQIVGKSLYEEVVYDNSFRNYDTPTQGIPHVGTGMSITWSGASFSGNSKTTPDAGAETNTVTGTVSPDGKTLLSVEYNYSRTLGNLQSYYHHELQNLPTNRGITGDPEKYIFLSEGRDTYFKMIGTKLVGPPNQKALERILQTPGIKGPVTISNFFYKE